MVAHLCGCSPPLSEDGAALARGKMGADGASPSNLPSQNMNLALVGPHAGFSNESGADGVFGHILPFFRVVFFFSQLGIPKISLPNGRVIRLGPVPCRMRFPKRDPLFQRCRCIHCRGAKEVEMVWHENISAHQPSICGTPSLAEDFVGGIVREDWFFTLSANG